MEVDIIRFKRKMYDTRPFAFATRRIEYKHL